MESADHHPAPSNEASALVVENVYTFPESDTKNIRLFAVHGDKIWVATSTGLVRRFNVTKHEFDFWTRMKGQPTCIHIAPSARPNSPVQVVVGSDIGEIGVFDHDFIRLSHLHLNSPIVAFASNDELTLLSASKDGDLVAWCLSNKLCLQQFKDPQYGILCLAAQPTNDLFASGCGDGTLRFWRVRRLPHEGVVLSEVKSAQCLSAVYDIRAALNAPQTFFHMRELETGRGMERFSANHWLRYVRDEQKITVFDNISDTRLGFVRVTHQPRRFEIQTIESQLYVVHLDDNGLHRQPICKEESGSATAPEMKRAKVEDD